MLIVALVPSYSLLFCQFPLNATDPYDFRGRTFLNANHGLPLLTLQSCANAHKPTSQTFSLLQDLHLCLEFYCRSLFPLYTWRTNELPGWSSPLRRTLAHWQMHTAAWWKGENKGIPILSLPFTLTFTRKTKGLLFLSIVANEKKERKEKKPLRLGVKKHVMLCDSLVIPPSSRPSSRLWGKSARSMPHLLIHCARMPFFLSIVPPFAIISRARTRESAPADGFDSSVGIPSVSIPS